MIFQARSRQQKATRRGAERAQRELVMCCFGLVSIVVAVVFVVYLDAGMYT